jgi:hypothetical protein
VTLGERVRDEGMGGGVTLGERVRNEGMGGKVTLGEWVRDEGIGGGGWDSGNWREEQGEGGLREKRAREEGFMENGEGGGDSGRTGQWRRGL